MKFEFELESNTYSATVYSAVIVVSLVGGLDDEVHFFIFLCKTCEERQLRLICIELRML